MSKQHLPHLTGIRFLASLWIVCNHFVPKETPSSLDHVVSRSNVAVSFFITMSGFITHWAYGRKPLAGGAFKQYLARRLGRVLFTTWVAMLLGLAVMAFTAPASMGGPGHVARCFCFVETWLHPSDWCPNGQTWTIAALLPSWVLYPWSRRLVAAAEDGGRAWGLVCLMLAAWGLEFGAIFYVYKRQGNNLTLQQHYETYTWPPSQLLDFFIGAAAAALARRLAAPADTTSGGAGWLLRWCGAVGDFGFAAVVLVCCVVPSDGYRVGYEPLYNHGVVPAFVCFLVGTAVAAAAPGAGPSCVARLLEHGILLALGACSFEVFLFQWPVHAAVLSLFGGRANESAEVFVLVCLVLWGSAAAYIARVEAPLVARLRQHTEPWGREEQPPRLAAPPFARVPTTDEREQVGYGSTAASMA